MATRNELIVETAKDQRVLDWLVRQVGWERIDVVLAKLPGGRKPYVSNIAKMLNLAVPDSVLATPAQQAQPEIRKILDYLRRRQ